MCHNDWEMGERKNQKNKERNLSRGEVAFAVGREKRKGTTTTTTTTMTMTATTTTTTTTTTDVGWKRTVSVEK